MNRPILLMLTAALLAGCTDTSTPDNTGGNGNTGGTDTVPTLPAGTLPTVGAAPETGPGPSKVRVSPTADDLAVMAYTNEFRTKGTVRGIDPTKTGLSVEDMAATKKCLTDTNWKPNVLNALNFNGVAHAAATSHALYLQTHGYHADGNPHSESSQRSNFTGVTAVDRFAAANKRYAAGETSTFVGENVLVGYYDDDSLNNDAPSRFHDNALYAVLGWIGSYGHCVNMLDAAYTDMGASYLNPTPVVDDPYNPSITPWKMIGAQIFVKR
ncbi:hypothetical protein IHN63_06590 [Deinococcus sp. 6YEL10]|uniref:CAP domain-containing protein n=1 Tax=Deinococcus sp. 6YEL10 TaxID=2745870 RepID=UPI001E5A009A|nr:CAP domain-containing protein [Deinococcus sp. 6YEL10]MCD0160977.1 hypothetical protein [Deinococcus sp. 6YEL10]